MFTRNISRIARRGLAKHAATTANRSCRSTFAAGQRRFFSVFDPDDGDANFVNPLAKEKMARAAKSEDAALEFISGDGAMLGVGGIKHSIEPLELDVLPEIGGIDQGAVQFWPAGCNESSAMILTPFWDFDLEVPHGITVTTDGREVLTGFTKPKPHTVFAGKSLPNSSGEADSSVYVWALRVSKYDKGGFIVGLAPETAATNKDLGSKDGGVALEITKTQVILWCDGAVAVRNPSFNNCSDPPRPLCKVGTTIAVCFEPAKKRVFFAVDGHWTKNPVDLPHTIAPSTVLRPAITLPHGGALVGPAPLFFQGQARAAPSLGNDSQSADDEIAALEARLAELKKRKS